MLEELKIRKLTVKDRKTLSNLIKKVAETAEGNKQLLNLISSNVTPVNENQGSEENGENQDSFISVGIGVIKLLLEVFEEETHKWFSDLLGVTEDKFLELPLDTEAKVIQQIIEAQEASSFFTIASQLYKKIGQFRSKFTTVKEK